MNLGVAIRKRRKELGYNQGTLALMVNLSQASLSQIEKQIKRPHPKSIIKIAEALNLTEGQLYYLGIDWSTIPPDKKDLGLGIKALFDVVMT